MKPLRRRLGSQGVARAEAAARALGIDGEKATGATQELADELAWAVERNTLSRGGVAELVRLLGTGKYADLLDNGEAATVDTLQQTGNPLLGEILGSKHESRGVANSVSRRTGVDSEALKKLLPVVASLLVGNLQKKSSNDLGAYVERLGFGSGDAVAAGGGSIKPQQPLPIPGDTIDTGDQTSGRGLRNPFDDLSDMIRRGGGRPTPGGKTPDLDGRQVGRSLRDVFGNILGFGSSGIIGWIIRLIVFRYGWRIVQFFLRRMFLGR